MLLETKKPDIDECNDNTDKSKYTPGISWVFDFDEEGSRVIHRNGGGSVIRVSPLRFGDVNESTSVSLKKVSTNDNPTLDEFLTDFEVEEASIKTSSSSSAAITMTTTMTTMTELITQNPNNIMNNIDSSNSNSSSSSSDSNANTNQSAISTFMDELEDLISS